MEATPVSLALALASTLVLAAVPARAESEPAAGPCEEIVAYLHEALAGPVPEPLIGRGLDYRQQERNIEGQLQSTWGSAPRTYITRVPPACRAETRRGAAPAATAAARALTQKREPEWIARGRILLCTMQDPASLGQVDAWMADADPQVRAVCVSELATWPGAELVRGPILGRAVRKRRGSWQGRWEIDQAVVAAANAVGTPDLAEELLPVLVAAEAHQALGYDELRDAVCTNEETMSHDRARACSTLPTDAEDEWWQSRQPNRLLASGALTTVFAGAVTGAFVERHDQAGRVIATGAGVPLGAMLGVTVVGVVVGSIEASRQKRGLSSAGDKVLLTSALIAGAAAGAAYGGWAAHRLAASSGARGPVTAIALAPVYLGTVLSININ